jgi:hypothetical protein
MIVRGPFTLKWGDNTIADIEAIDVDYSHDSEDYPTLDGRTFEVDGNIKVTAVITLLGTDIGAIAALLPQHFVANGQVMSTGETVNNAQGAIDIAAHDCDSDLLYNNLDITGCAAVPDVARIVNARTKMEDFEFDVTLRKVMIKFIGEPAQDEGSVQFFKQGTINVVS